MPNWIEGTMKLRGKMVDIKRFINEGIHGYDFIGENERPKSEYLKDNLFDDNIIYCDIFNGPHVDGTRRMFINDTTIEMNDNEGTCCFNVRQAWSFTSTENDLPNLIALADKYNVDIRLFGIESGMQFTQEIIVKHGKDSVKGEVILNNTHTFEDWEWECPFPRMGG